MKPSSVSSSGTVVSDPASASSPPSSGGARTQLAGNPVFFLDDMRNDTLVEFTMQIVTWNMAVPLDDTTVAYTILVDVNVALRDVFG